ncbi:hypothetical protein ABEF95_015901 [Exophiala dermatitidis]
MAAVELPPLPVPIHDFVDYTNKYPATQAGVAEAVRPFKAFESKLREVYAQHPDHPAAAADHLVPVFGGAPITTKARDLASEPATEKEKYLLSFPDKLRRKHGSPAVVDSLEEFKKNFNLFSESSLVDLDWNNVCVAGSAVVTSLLPVDAPHNESKRALRTYYNEKLAPASDVDIFLYGLDEDQAIEKIKQIEATIRDSILAEITTVRTKNAITIVSEYPIRHVQIVLRLYKSISEVLTGFDVDCSCVAFDGNQVWASPRALAAFMTQLNSIDLTRRSPSYENRLSKYSHRGFEAYWPELDRSRVDPTIYERSFTRVQGLARLLVLEKLPYPQDRDAYLAKRREERGRPPLRWNATRRSRHVLPGDVKASHPDDVGDWVEEDDVSDYHTFTIPYGPKYNAKKVEKLLFTKDLLLNSEWNRPKDRKARLHRHPAFFGPVEDVIHDCCGFCPEPTTDEDFAALEEESRIFISGDLTFLKDNPGRQAIGSFHPITDDDWTEMAYVGNTTRLCQAIVDQDLDAVQDWFCSLEGADVNRRDHTGRTPLQLAAMCSTPDIVQCLIEHGARLVSRLYNGMTALHIAAHRGETQIVKALLDRSAANEEQESRKEEAKKEARRAAASHHPVAEQPGVEDEKTDDADSWDSDLSGAEDEDNEDDDKMTEGSFVKISPEHASATGDELAEDKEEPDVYDVDVLAWDSPLSPLHLAILGGHLDTIELLVDDFGADVLLPVKLMDDYNPKRAKAAILSLVLALEPPLKKANETVKALLAHGTTLAQADMNSVSVLHYAVNGGKALILETLKASADAATFRNACNHVVTLMPWWNLFSVEVPLVTAIRTGRREVAEFLIANGAKTRIDFESFAQAYARKQGRSTDDPEQVRSLYEKKVEQPITVALEMEMLDLVNQLIDEGGDVNTLPAKAYEYCERPDMRGWDKSLLDLVQDRIKSLRKFLYPAERRDTSERAEPLGKDEEYLGEFDRDSYQYWTAYHDLCDAKNVRQWQIEKEQKELQHVNHDGEEGGEEKRIAVERTLAELTKIEEKLVAKGAQTFAQLRPYIKPRRPHFFLPTSPDESSPYTTKISFMVADLTPEKKADYVKLFEAAWQGDASTVKELCLSRTRPLQVAVQDLRGFSPFSIAVLRGHYDVAELIVEIATVQYRPRSKSEEYHYTLHAGREYNEYSDYSEDSGDDGEVDSDEDDVRVLRQVVDETFTIDNVATLAENVKSSISPATMVSWPCQVTRAIENKEVEQSEIDEAFEADWGFTRWVYNRSYQSWSWFESAFDYVNRKKQQSLIRYAIFTDNLDLLKFLVKVGSTLASRCENDESLKTIQPTEVEFQVALRLGRVKMIEEMIKSTGVGLAIQKIFQKAGLQLDQKPQYYQGLTVHGRKRQDWTEARRLGYRHRQDTSDAPNPRLTAIAEGNLRAAQYFLGDGPLRRYLEFAETRNSKDDVHIQALAKAEGGVEAALQTWLSTRSHLALHLAVLSPPLRDGSQPVLDYLLRKEPELDLLDSRAADGRTPLYVAFEAGRYYAAKKLIEAGADVTIRDDTGRNVLHALLDQIDHRHHALLRSVLRLMDSETVGRLLLERCNDNTETTTATPTILTPLALFLNRIDISSTRSDWERSLALLLSYPNGQDLEIMDGADDYPLHTAVRRGHLGLVRFIVEYRPSLLYFENATGMTPAQVVTASYLRKLTEDPPKLVQTQKWSVENVPPKEFVKQKRRREAGDDAQVVDDVFDEDEDDHIPGTATTTTRDPPGRGVSRSNQWKMNQLITDLMNKYPSTRKLVSLHDANQVAKRLALQQQLKKKQKEEEEERKEQEARAGGGGGAVVRPRRYLSPNNPYIYGKEKGNKDQVVSQYFDRAKNSVTPWDWLVWRREEAKEEQQDDEDGGEEAAKELQRLEKEYSEKTHQQIRWWVPALK